jgi:hypothetical protein
VLQDAIADLFAGVPDAGREAWVRTLEAIGPKIEATATR